MVILTGDHTIGLYPRVNFTVEESVVKFPESPDQPIVMRNPWDQDEGCRVAAAYSVCCNERPQIIDFMLFPRQSLIEHGIELDHKPDEGLPEFLSSRHLGTRGPRHEPNKEFIMHLLSSDVKLIKRLSKKEIEQIARTLIDEVPSLRDHVGEKWRPRLSDQ